MWIFRFPAAFPIVLGTALLLGFASSQPARACGSIHHWIAKYSGAGVSDMSRESALRELSTVCGDYAGKASDPQLLDVLRDAVRRGLDTRRIQNVFNTYRCLSGVRDEGAYGELRAALDTSGCPTGEQLKAWRESRVDDALIRGAPAKGAKRVGWLRKGAVVEKLGAEGDWIKVRTWTGLTGYVHVSLLADY